MPQPLKTDSERAMADRLADAVASAREDAIVAGQDMMAATTSAEFRRRMDIFTRCQERARLVDFAARQHPQKDAHAMTDAEWKVYKRKMGLS